MTSFSFVISVTALCALSTLALAEPTNLQVYKNQLIQYVNSGDYLKEQQSVTKKASIYLDQYVAFNQKQVAPKKLAMVLDIDETSLSNYPDMLRLSFGGTLPEINHDENIDNDPVIAPTLALYNHAKKEGVAVFFITGRAEWLKAHTISNLKTAGYQQWDGLVFRTKTTMTLPAETYKSAVRKQLVDQGYTIVVNMGDQQSDLSGGYAEKGFKLPNPFYYIP